MHSHEFDVIRQHLPVPPVASTKRARREDDVLAGRAPVAERAADALAVLEQLRDRALHEDVDARVHGLVLQRADQLEPGAVADVHEPLVGVAAERALRHLAVGRAVEDAAPLLELAHAVGRLLRVQLGHAPVVEVLAARHRVLEVDLPVVLGVDVAERRGDAALGHHRVRLAEQRLAHERRPGAGVRGVDRGAQPGAAGADHDHVVVVALDATQMIRGSSKTPSRPGGCRDRRAPTHIRLIHAHSMCRPLSTPTPRQSLWRGARARAREAVEPAADQVAHRVAAEREQRQQDAFASSTSEPRPMPNDAVEEERAAGVVPEEAEHDRGQVQEVPVGVLEDERERRLTAVAPLRGAHRAGGRRQEERAVVRLR